MAKATGIDHVVIYVSDMEAVKKFFLEGLGLVPAGDYEDEFFMDIGKQKIAIFQGENKTQTVDHLAVNVDDFEGVKKWIEKLGFKFDKHDSVVGPNGIRVQLIP